MLILPTHKPTALLEKAIKAVPAVKYALGVGGIFGVIAIVRGWSIDPLVVVFGVPTMLVLMIGVVIFANLAAAPARTFDVPAKVMTWFSMVLLMATVVVGFTSVLFDWPLPLRRRIFYKQDGKSTTGSNAAPAPAPASGYSTTVSKQVTGPTDVKAGRDGFVSERSTRPLPARTRSNVEAHPERPNGLSALAGLWQTDVVTGPCYSRNPDCRMTCGQMLRLTIQETRVNKFEASLLEFISVPNPPECTKKYPFDNVKKFHTKRCSFEGRQLTLELGPPKNYVLRLAYDGSALRASHDSATQFFPSGLVSIHPHFSGLVDDYPSRSVKNVDLVFERK